MLGESVKNLLYTWLQEGTGFIVLIVGAELEEEIEGHG